jgi:hypothetical protein
MHGGVSTINIEAFQLEPFLENESKAAHIFYVNYSRLYPDLTGDQSEISNQQ